MAGELKYSATLSVDQFKSGLASIDSAITKHEAKTAGMNGAQSMFDRGGLSARKFAMSLGVIGGVAMTATRFVKALADAGAEYERSFTFATSQSERGREQMEKNTQAWGMFVNIVKQANDEIGIVTSLGEAWNIVGERMVKTLFGKETFDLRQGAQMDELRMSQNEMVQVDNLRAFAQMRAAAGDNVGAARDNANATLTMEMAQIQAQLREGKITGKSAWFLQQNAVNRKDATITKAENEEKDRQDREKKSAEAAQKQADAEAKRASEAEARQRKEREHLDFMTEVNRQSQEAQLLRDEGRDAEANKLQAFIELNNEILRIQEEQLLTEQEKTALIKEADAHLAKRIPFLDKQIEKEALERKQRDGSLTLAEQQQLVRLGGTLKEPGRLDPGPYRTLGPGLAGNAAILQGTFGARSEADPNATKQLKLTEQIRDSLRNIERKNGGAVLN